VIELLSEGSLRKRLCKYFIKQQEKRGQNSFSVNMNGLELSQYLAVNRSAMSRELSRLKNDGVLSFSGGRCEILNIDKLLHEAK
jgi:CRP-like cAMP-binding protein